MITILNQIAQNEAATGFAGTVIMIACAYYMPTIKQKFGKRRKA